MSRPAKRGQRVDRAFRPHKVQTVQARLAVRAKEDRKKKGTPKARGSKGKTGCNEASR